MPPSRGIRCIDLDCEERLCSVIALRAHVALFHGKFLNYNVAMSNRYDVSISTLGACMDLLKKDTRSRMARFVDIEHGLPFDGKLPRVKRPITPMNRKPHLIAQKPQILPIYVDKRVDKNMFDCGICHMKSYGEATFKTHFIRTHIFPCLACCRCFATKIDKSRHFCSSIFDREFLATMLSDSLTPITFSAYILSNGTVPSVECENCRVRLRLTEMYSHFLNAHFHLLRYIVESGEILPHGVNARIDNVRMSNGAIAEAVDINLDKNEDFQTERCRMVRGREDLRASVMNVADYNGKLLVTPPIGTYLYTKAAKKYQADIRLTCYLCEMPFDTTADLDEHLERHPEKWKNCPFCKVKITGHYDMQKHLLHFHTTRQFGSMFCNFCGTSVTKAACSHMIYHCRESNACGICGAKQASYDTLIAHMKKAHLDLLRRYQCNMCGQYFITLNEFREHVCRMAATIYCCVCSNGNRVFTSAADYCDHFDFFHVERNLVCSLCKQPQNTEANMARHRIVHMHRVTPYLSRRPYVLPRWMNVNNRDLVPAWQRSTNGTALHGSRAANMTARSRGPPQPGTIAASLEKIINSATPSPPSMDEPPGLVDINDDADDIVVVTVPARNGSQNGPNAIQNRSVTVKYRSVPFQNGSSAIQNRTAAIHNGPASIKTRSVPSQNGSSCIQNGLLPVRTARHSQNSHSAQNAPPRLQPSVANGASLSSQSSVTANVRSERVEKDSAGANVPGYVPDADDDDIDEIDSSKAIEIEAVAPKVIEVVDENGDDELAVIAEVEKSSGVAITSVSTREKKFKCTRCSMAFMTKKSLTAHMSSHAHDLPSSTCSEIFGLPKECNGYVCRNCSLVFESKPKYDEHMRYHGPSTGLSCQKCSGIAFNNGMLGQHIHAHNLNSIVFSCGICLLKYPNDHYLMEHLYTVHKVPYFAFCKICGRGSTRLDSVYRHVTEHMVTDMSVIQRIGTSPAALFNYEPLDVAKHKLILASGRLQVIEPSDCTHRSSLLSTDGMLVACKKCFCMTTFLNYLTSLTDAEKENVSWTFGELEKPQSPLFSVFPLYSHLSTENQSHLQTLVAPTQQQINPMQGTTVRHAVMESLGVSGRSYIRRPASTMIGGAFPSLHQVPRHRAVITNQPPQLTQAFQSSVTDGHQTHRVVMRPAWQSQSAVARATASASNSTNSIMEQVNGNRPDACIVCQATLSTEYDKLKHLMHTKTEHKWFCTNCAFSAVDEMSIVTHYYRLHIEPLYMQKKLEKGPDCGFKPIVFDLRCPKCRGITFNTLKLFERHLASHTDILPYVAECGTAFATEAKKFEHDQKHQECNECCILCGTTDLWAVPKSASTPFVLSHVIRHGLDYHSSCRVCFVRFSDDTTYAKLFDHYKNMHATVYSAKDKSLMCKACGVIVSSMFELLTHMKTKHTMNVISRSSASKEGEFYVRANTQMFSYLGLNRKMQICTEKDETSESPSSPASSNQP
ncbi:unnamed protein product [Caenorhabditis bovis]|uniref:C2H2-type domain-containing protein n=1 Tax=Caenorhabditis bovis TaxID=2654633 RepID=A0A8S1EUB5_9PELO|nr:unnamed protein product [Caenorhabditis bovis]